MAIDLTDTYDRGLGADDQQTPPIKPTRPRTHEELMSFLPSDISNYGPKASSYNPDEYTGYLTDGLYESKGDPDLQRGEAQSALDKWGNAVVQTGVKAGTQLIDMAGGLTSLLTEGFGDNRDYQNIFTDAADKANEWTDKNFPLYRRSTGTWGDAGDLSFWLQNGSGVAASVIGFAVGGAGIAKGLGAIGKLTGAGRRVGSMVSGLSDVATATKFVNAGEKTLTAGMLAYEEAAQFGRQIYNDVYTAQLKQGKSEEEAKHIAAQSAASGVQLNTMVATGLNLVGGVGMFFDHEKDAVIEAAHTLMKQEVGEGTVEGLGKYITRLKEMDPKNYTKELGLDHNLFTTGKKVATAAREAVGEGVEELTNQWAQASATNEGKKGNVHGFAEQLSLLSDYYDTTFNEEGALNFVMGAIAGPVQNTVAAGLPIHKVAMGMATDGITGERVDKDGKPVSNDRDAAVNYYENGKRVTSAKKNRIQTGVMFNNIKERMIADAEHLQSTQEEIVEAMKSGDLAKAENLRHSMFDLMNMRSVQLGMAEHMKETYRSIAGLDNTKTDTQEVQETLNQLGQQLTEAQGKGEDTAPIEEAIAKAQSDLLLTKNQTAAMKVGFATKPGDNRFIEKAEKAVKDLGALKILHEEVFKKYGVDKDWSSPEQGHVADFIFQTLADMHLTKSRIESSKAELEKFDMPLDGNGVLDERAIAAKAARDWARKTRQNSIRSRKNLATIDEINRLANLPQTPENNLALEKALDYFGVVSMEGETPKEISERLTKAVKEKIDKDNAEYEELQKQNLGTEEFAAWSEKNPEGKTEDYFKELMEKQQDSLYQKALVEHISDEENRLDILKGVHETITKSATLSTIMKNTTKFYDKLGEKLKKQRDSANRNVKEVLDNESQIQKYNKTVRERLQRKFTAESTKLATRLGKIHDELSQLSQLIGVIKLNSADPVGEVRDLMKSVAKLKAEADFLTKQINTYTEYIYRLENSTTMPHTPAPLAPPVTPTGPSKLEIAIQGFIAELQKYPTKQAEILVVVEEVRTTKEFSLGAFTRDGINLSSDDSAKLMTAVKAMLEAQGVVLTELAETIEEGEEAIQNIPEPLDFAATIMAQSPDNFLEPDLSATTIEDPDEKGGVEGFKQVDSASSGASRSTVFFEKRWADNKVRRESTSLWEETASKKVVQHDQLTANTPVTISIDLTYSGTVQYTPQIVDAKTGSLKPSAIQQVDIPAGHYLTSKGEVKSYLRPDGTIDTDNPEAIGNMPIKIVTADGETPQWLHTVNWIERKDPLAVDADGKPLEDAWYNTVNVLRDAEGNIKEENNVAKQSAAMFSYRMALAKAHNRGETETKTKVKTKGPGKYVYAPNNGIKASIVLKESNVVQGSRKVSQVPMVLVRGKSLIGVENLPGMLNSIDQEGIENLDGRVVALVRMANGARTLVPLKGNKLPSKPDDTSFQAFNRILELYLQHDEAEMKALKALGFNFLTDANGKLTKDGLRNFVSQYYTYFSTAVGEGLQLRSVGENIVISYTDDAGTQSWTMAVDDTGKLTEDSKKAVATLFDNRYRGVAFTSPARQMIGLNDPSEINEFIYDGTKWRAIKHSSYNDFISTHLVSPIVPINYMDGGVDVTDANGKTHKEFYYGANPIIEYDTDPILALNNRPSTVIPDGEVANTPTTVEDEAVDVEGGFGAGLGLDVGSMSPSVEMPKTSTKTVGTQKVPAVSLESLTEMYNFTPQSERNGTTPQEMFDYFRRIQVTHPPEGFNPFKRC